MYKYMVKHCSHNHETLTTKGSREEIRSDDLDTQENGKTRGDKSHSTPEWTEEVSN